MTTRTMMTRMLSPLPSAALLAARAPPPDRVMNRAAIRAAPNLRAGIAPTNAPSNSDYDVPVTIHPGDYNLI